MNEITKIHLGRQAFTIAVDAHDELRAYLEAIKDQVDDKEVVQEVELRMAELLAEHGITGDKVILSKDVDFLKSQLGDPEDFNDANESTVDKEPVAEGRRLFRDTTDGMVAGVAAGLAKYFGVDIWLVRILFVIGIVSGGWGILLYIILWLLVPEAKTSSERLQMAGKPVTVSSLKQAVARADISGAAKRANSSLSGPINSIFRAILKVIGAFLIIIGLSLLFAFIAIEGYVLVHAGTIFGQDIFPNGVREHLLLNLGVAVSALLSLLIVIFGISIFKQKWPVRPWATGTLVGLILLGLAGSIALGADSAPQIRDRYDASFHRTTRTVPAFTDVRVYGNVGIDYIDAPTYTVSLKYFDHPDVSKIKTSVTGNTLIVDATRFDNLRHCSNLCIPDTYDLQITITGPNVAETSLPVPPPPLRKP